jgi:hypothetical protein
MPHPGRRNVVHTSSSAGLESPSCGPWGGEYQEITPASSRSIPQISQSKSERVTSRFREATSSGICPSRQRPQDKLGSVRKGLGKGARPRGRDNPILQRLPGDPTASRGPFEKGASPRGPAFHFREGVPLGKRSSMSPRGRSRSPRRGGSSPGEAQVASGIPWSAQDRTSSSWTGNGSRKRSACLKLREANVGFRIRQDEGVGLRRRQHQAAHVPGSERRPRDVTLTFTVRWA